MENNIKVSLIVVNYNGFEITKNCVESIFLNSSNISFEVIVVDNASTDKSAEKLKKFFAKKNNFLVIRKAKNDFLAEAYNKGFKKSQGNIVIFMNNDLIVTKNWLTNLLKTFNNKDVGVAGVALLSWGQKNRIDNLGCDLNFLGYGKRIDAKKSFKSARTFREVFFVPGSVLAIKRKIFERLKGFDKNFGGNYEDVDLCWRARLLGYKAVIAERAIVYHLGSWTVKKYLKNTKASFLCRKNRLATILKNAGITYLVLILPLYLLTSLIVFLKEFLIDWNFKLAKQTPRAIAWVFKNKKQIFNKRKIIQQSRLVSDWAILKKMSFN